MPPLLDDASDEVRPLRVGDRSEAGADEPGERVVAAHGYKEEARKNSGARLERPHRGLAPDRGGVGRPCCAVGRRLIDVTMAEPSPRGVPRAGALLGASERVVLQRQVRERHGRDAQEEEEVPCSVEQLGSSVAILRRRAELAKTVFDCPNLSGPSVMPDVLDHLLSAHEMQTVPVDTLEPALGSPSSGAISSGGYLPNVLAFYSISTSTGACQCHLCREW